MTSGHKPKPGDGLDIYSVEPEEGYQWVGPVDKTNFEVLRNIAKMDPKLWRSMELRILEDGYGSPKSKEADLPWLLAHVLVFRQCSIERGREILDGSGEFLPATLAATGEPMWLFSPTVHEGAIDVDASSVVRFPNSSKVMRVKEYVFATDAFENLVALRDPIILKMFVTGETVKKFKEVKLTGVKFDLVWSYPAA